jgi:hypothetical protein
MVVMRPPKRRRERPVMTSPISNMRICGDVLMEDDWEEGFTCTRPWGHYPYTRHRAEGDGIGELNISTDNKGRTYNWVMEWGYADE